MGRNPLSTGRRRFGLPAAVGLALCCTALLAPAQGTATDLASAADTFRSRYDRLLEAAGAGKVPEEIRLQASRLWVSLQHYLVDADAAIDQLKVDSQRLRGDAQAEALGRLVDKVAERERVAAARLGELEQLLAGKVQLEPRPGVADSSTARPGSDEGPQVELRFGPEDLTKTRME